MFDKLKSMFQDQKGQGVRVLAPIQGECVALGEVPDPTFGEGLLGEGVAIRPAKGRVVSPVNGTVALMFETGHAISLLSDDGVELLIHVGLDTVKLKGQHFTMRVKTGDKVKTGEILLEFDEAAIAAAGYSTITPVVVTNMDNFSSLDTQTGKTVQELDEIIILHNK